MLLIVGSIQSFYAQATPERQAETRGQQMLRATRDQIRSFDALRIFFTFHMENTALNSSETQTGELLLRGDRYNMKLGDNRFISDGVTTWSYVAELNEVYINNIGDSEEALTPTALLDDFENRFRARHMRRETHQGKPVEIIDLLPKTPHTFHMYRVAIDPDTHMLVYTIAFDREGGTFKHSIDRFEANPRIPANAFTFDATRFPGLEVIDLR
ncbi:MAG TPA: outer membrane lipoprotein carrier protein LolA [Bacteroidales bacterium]|nr:outer membrane lipoprotein carrier protein LolA [Bacteroidales bacterium]